jgi:histidyl-tRNA synthetase
VDFQPPKGTLDFLPPAGDRLRALYERAARLAGLHGYHYVETPVFEATELFKRTSGETSDVVSKETYSFEDRGGRHLTLRPEGTAPVMRAYLHDAHAQALPFKAFYLTTMYRYSRPQAGRHREHRQFGIEVIGEPAPGADVEVIAVGNRFLRELGLSKFRVEVNSIGDETCRPAYRELLIGYFRDHVEELADEHRERYVDNPFRVLDCKDEACRAVAAGAPRITDHLCDACRAHFDAVVDGLRSEDIEPIVTPTMVRGLDYYTRTAFEFVSTALNAAQSTLFGGGRYDGLAEALGGPHVPGIGFGMGLERVLLALDEEGVDPPEGAALDCFIIAFGDLPWARAGQVTRQLRERGLNTDRAFEPASVKHQFRTADRLGARFAVVIGARELEAGTVTARRLADGAERTGALDEAIAWMKDDDPA